MMWKVPHRIIIASGSAEGSTPMGAFDKALLVAEIGNLNLIKVSSIVPPGAEVLRLKDIRPLRIATGTLIPGVYTYVTSDTAGQRITSVIAVGKPLRKSDNGVIFEVSLFNNLITARSIAESMVKEAFEIRNLKLDRVIVEGSEAVVNSGFSCVVAAALMLP